jgi:bifunctional DNA-binding transcriptional regulator/antitoxin component of YhaV-PrlF toxin-antitoxin module
LKEFQPQRHREALVLVVKDPVIVVATSNAAIIVLAVLSSNELLKLRHDNEANRDHEITDGPPKDESEDGCNQLLIQQTSEDHNRLPSRITSKEEKGRVPQIELPQFQWERKAGGLRLNSR